jgi:hypothetical protein
MSYKRTAFRNSTIGAIRHCEERSDAAIHLAQAYGLPRRYAPRNDVNLSAQLVASFKRDLMFEATTPGFMDLRLSPFALREDDNVEECYNSAVNTI